MSDSDTSMVNRRTAAIGLRSPVGTGEGNSMLIFPTRLTQTESSTVHRVRSAGAVALMAAGHSKADEIAARLRVAMHLPELGEPQGDLPPPPRFRTIPVL